ncbi:hypothetical protein EhV362 [Emiliania huxleyi virus 86]|uniref:Putative membrane protein n=2 Tax=Emiliania huxleyi virus 86 TaxID=181082 RepID=Q4A2B7_EHV8U|nr:hypothetical protein EhV362 [Emiliania huxleyi virus 86]AHA54970.1 putative membrane protein [Emiliania huxleyi virus 145]CAI65789.1 putative membrane protein [Emiliania huxleyi virus 86]|mmetsp:Transcript_8092/g.24028  ORF Transcript_8092/g.24028 Transcript_8092/m.24028 type:complete len:86 (-) Transcript_8092:2970-3227(-)
MTTIDAMLPVVIVVFLIFWATVAWCQWNNKRQMRNRIAQQRAAALQTISISTTSRAHAPVYESVPGQVALAVPVVVAEIVTPTNE